MGQLFAAQLPEALFEWVNEWKQLLVWGQHDTSEESARKVCFPGKASLTKHNSVAHVWYAKHVRQSHLENVHKNESQWTYPRTIVPETQGV